jgi:hypothetical protein
MFVAQPVKAGEPSFNSAFLRFAASFSSSLLP